MKHTVTNHSRHPRTIFHGGRGTTIPMGAAVDIEMTESEAANAVAAGVTIVAEKAPATDAGLDRQTAIRSIVASLDAGQDFTEAGLPKVDAINALIEGDPVTAAERDAVWAAMQGG